MKIRAEISASENKKIIDKTVKLKYGSLER